MKRNLYVIYDRVAEESGPVFEAVNDGIANRRYKALISEQSHEWFDENDYILFQVGTIDKTTNVVTAIEPNEIYIKLSLIDEEKNAESV